MSLVSLVPNVKAPTVSNVDDNSNRVSSTVSGIKSSIPVVKTPSISTTISTTPSSASAIQTLTRGSLPEPKLGMDGLKSSMAGAVDVKSVIGNMKSSLASSAIVSAITSL